MIEVGKVYEGYLVRAITIRGQDVRVQYQDVSSYPAIWLARLIERKRWRDGADFVVQVNFNKECREADERAEAETRHIERVEVRYR